MGTNNLSNETSLQIYDKLLNLVHFVKENNPNFHVALTSPIDRLDNGIDRLDDGILTSYH